MAETLNVNVLVAAKEEYTKQLISLDNDNDVKNVEISSVERVPK